MTKVILIDYLSSQFGVSKNQLGPDTTLFSAGRLDSLDMTEIVSFIEQEASIHIRKRQINLENLDTINRMLQFVERIRGY